MVGNAPTRGTMNPAPALHRTSPMGSVNPLGAPLRFASCENEYCVFAMHIGNLANPCAVNIAIFSSACSLNETSFARYSSHAIFEIFSLMPMESGYKSLNSLASLFFSHAAATASPSFVAPFPPSAWCVHSTQSSAPAAIAAARIASCSSAVSDGNTFSATTTGTPNFFVFSTCRVKLATPFFTSSTSSRVYASASGFPGVTAGPPP
mmetsp:Transcript_3343/g.11234  ORF Transcript_3343/g.11234 Transcript_3343/m.11234 type:complete len:207 (-) Transcript_3343:1311-1931(-)